MRVVGIDPATKSRLCTVSDDGGALEIEHHFEFDDTWTSSWDERIRLVRVACRKANLVLLEDGGGFMSRRALLAFVESRARWAQALVAAGVRPRDIYDVNVRTWQSVLGVQQKMKARRSRVEGCATTPKDIVREAAMNEYELWLEDPDAAMMATAVIQGLRTGGLERVEGRGSKRGVIRQAGGDKKSRARRSRKRAPR